MRAHKRTYSHVPNCKGGLATGVGCWNFSISLNPSLSQNLMKLMKCTNIWNKLLNFTNNKYKINFENGI